MELSVTEAGIAIVMAEALLANAVWSVTLVFDVRLSEPVDDAAAGSSWNCVLVTRPIVAVDDAADESNVTVAGVVIDRDEAL